MVYQVARIFHVTYDNRDYAVRVSATVDYPNPPPERNFFIITSPLSPEAERAILAEARQQSEQFNWAELEREIREDALFDWLEVEVEEEEMCSDF